MRALVVIALVILVGLIAPRAVPAQDGSSGSAQPQIVWRKVGDALKQPLKQMVYVEAKLMSKQTPQDGTKQPFSYFIADETGTARVVIFSDVHQKIGNASEFVKGVTLQIYGEISDFKDQRQILVNEPNYIRVKPGASSGSRFHASAPSGSAAGFIPVSIGTLTMTTVGNTVSVSGTISEVKPSAAEKTPTKIKVKDDTGEITVVFWKEVAGKLAGQIRLKVGEPLQVSGTVQEYRSTLQLRVDDAGDIRQVAPGGDNAAAPDATPATTTP